MGDNFVPEVEHRLDPAGPSAPWLDGFWDKRPVARPARFATTTICMGPHNGRLLRGWSIRAQTSPHVRQLLESDDPTLVGYDHVAGPGGNKPVPDLATSVPAPTERREDPTRSTPKRASSLARPSTARSASMIVLYAIERLAHPKDGRVQRRALRYAHVAVSASAQHVVGRAGALAEGSGPSTSSYVPQVLDRKHHALRVVTGGVDEGPFAIVDARQALSRSHEPSPIAAVDGDHDLPDARHRDRRPRVRALPAPAAKRSSTRAAASGLCRGSREWRLSADLPRPRCWRATPA